MDKIVIHAGMPKTGTTALQEFFVENGEWSEREGILYPQSGRFPGDAAHHELFVSAASFKKYIKTPFYGRERRFSVVVGEVISEIERSDKSITLLSSEALWNGKAFDQEALERIRDAFHNFKVEIVVSLRDIEKLALSGYKQRVTGPQRYKDSIAHHIAEHALNGVWDYARRLMEFSSVFGYNNLYVYWYDEVEKDGISPVFWVIGTCDLRIDFPLSNPSKGWAYVRVNRYLNLVQCWLPMRVCNWMRHFITRILSFSGLNRKGSVIDQALNPLSPYLIDLLKNKNYNEHYIVSSYFKTDWWR